MSNETTLEIRRSRPGRTTAYDTWQQGEGIRVVEGFYVSDVRELPLDPWERMGALGAFLNFEQTGGLNGAYVCEIPPGGSTQPQRHMYEELLFVVTGNGATSVWLEGQPPHNFEWKAGSVFALPLNAYYQHFNVSGNEPARFVAETTAPLVMNLFHNERFVFGDPFVFEDRFNGKPDHFSAEGISMGLRWVTNFVPDVRVFTLQDLAYRGAGGTNIQLEIGNGTLNSHISEFPSGTYKKAHRHDGDAHVNILNGHGYTLMWKEGGERHRFDWKEGSLLVPPEGYFHQHFNTAPDPSRYLALRCGSGQNYRLTRSRPRADTSVNGGENQIEYADEDPTIRAEFEEALARNGVVSRMDEVLAAAASA